MKKIFNRLICLFRGHKWDRIGKGFTTIGIVSEWPYYTYKCSRCGKTKEEVI